MLRTRRELVFFVLGGFFLTNAILGEVTGGKLIQASLLGYKFVLPIGVIPWPIVFITTDLINEYFGREGVRKLTFLAVGMILYCFAVLLWAMNLEAWEFSPVSTEAFKNVFGQSLWIIAGSISAFITSQFIDVMVFLFFKKRTGHRYLWLRATGSTAVSQLIDTYIVQYIGFVLPGKIGFKDYIVLGFHSYCFKLAVAIGITPIIYFGHGLIDRFLSGDKHEAAGSGK